MIDHLKALGILAAFFSLVSAITWLIITHSDIAFFLIFGSLGVIIVVGMYSFCYMIVTGKELF